MSMWGGSRFPSWYKNQAKLPNAQSSLSNILLLLKPGDGRALLVQGGRRWWQWTLNFSLGASLYLCCSPGTAQQCFPIHDHRCLYISFSSLQVANVLICELIWNVGYITKNSENSLVFTALNVNWKNSKCKYLMFLFRQTFYSLLAFFF